MKNKVREGIAWAIAAVATAVILTVAMGAVFYAINYLLVYALGVPMLGYTQLCALGLVCVWAYTYHERHRQERKARQIMKGQRNV